VFWRIRNLDVILVIRIAYVGSIASLHEGYTFFQRDEREDRENADREITTPVM
jgi:hypothetical protein